MRYRCIDFFFFVNRLHVIVCNNIEFQVLKTLRIYRKRRKPLMQTGNNNIYVTIMILSSELKRKGVRFCNVIFCTKQFVSGTVVSCQDTEKMFIYTLN